VATHNYPWSVTACLDRCYWAYDQCARDTPECATFDQMRAALHSGDAEAYADMMLQAQVLERANACVTRCGEPNRLCGRRCFAAFEDAAVPRPR
jgi:hypothetical protein